MKYRATKKRNLGSKQIEVERKIKVLEGQLTDTLSDGKQKEKNWTELERKRRELETIIEYQTKGAILRSKSRLYNEGEKNTAYFLNLEKRHCKQGTITQLKDDEDKLILSDKEILSECESYYKTLYSSKVNEDSAETFFSPLQNGTFLNNEEQLFCEGPLNLKECLGALKDMVSEKTPGTDGLPCEFYKVFWNDIGEILIKALNYSYDTGSLSISQRRGIVKLIPKKDADLTSIKNWRPITLLL